jgi:ribonuclease HII
LFDVDAFGEPNSRTSGSSRARRLGSGSDATSDKVIPTLERERELWGEGCRYVAGLDEVGRGPLAGPVVAAAVVFAPDAEPIDGLRDSKKLTARRREVLAVQIKSRVLTWGIGAASVKEVDRRNILCATGLAMRRALAHLSVTPGRLLIDGTALPELRFEHEYIVKGDSLSQSIAAASILAKCVRDRIMTLLSPRYPAFHWDNNMGYATSQHLSALQSIGLTPHHRKSFEPVGQLTLF